MIKTRKQLNHYLLCDKAALGINKKNPSLIGDSIWKFERLYRRTEYHFNNRDNLLHYIAYMVAWYRFRVECKKRCCEIPLNVVDKGLAIWHCFNITINSHAKIGKNFSISKNCCIGQAHGEYPVIGDHVEMCYGSTVLGGVSIANNTTIGAGALLIKNVEEEYTTLGGVPAKCISYNINEYVAGKKERLKKLM